MRPIKFRAWDKKDKIVREVYGLLFKRISNKGNRDFDLVEMHCSDYEGSKAIILSHFERLLEDVILMQYTGLKDKNGKEIYEGDIVRFNTKVEGLKPEYSEKSHEITWNDKLARFELKGHWYGGGLIYTGYEVVGNKFENPGLLTPPQAE